MRDLPLIVTMIAGVLMGVVIVVGAVEAQRTRAELVRLCIEADGVPEADGTCDRGPVAPAVVHLTGECR